jgi:hypothetical protein
MTKFAFKKVEEINCYQDIVKLEIDGSCYFDQFQEEIYRSKSQYISELGMVLQYIERDGNGKHVADKKKDITPGKAPIKEYEYRTKHLRVYAIRQKDGKIIILGGYKNKQKRDIRKFRKIKKQLIDLKLV